MQTRARMPPRGYEEEHPSVERHRHRGIARGGTYGAMLTAKTANFDGRSLPRRFYRCGLPSDAWAAVVTRAKSSGSLATIYFLNPAVSNNELLIGDPIGRAPTNFPANTI